MKSKLKHFPLFMIQKNETNVVKKRRDKLRNSLKNIFPNHNVNVFIFIKGWRCIATNSKGAVYLTKHYGSNVDIVLS